MFKLIRKVFLIVSSMVFWFSKKKSRCQSCSIKNVWSLKRFQKFDNVENVCDVFESVIRFFWGVCIVFEVFLKILENFWSFSSLKRFLFCENFAKIESLDTEHKLRQLFSTKQIGETTDRTTHNWTVVRCAMSCALFFWRASRGSPHASCWAPRGPERCWARRGPMAFASSPTIPLEFELMFSVVDREIDAKPMLRIQDPGVCPRTLPFPNLLRCGRVGQNTCTHRVSPRAKMATGSAWLCARMRPSTASCLH